MEVTNKFDKQFSGSWSVSSDRLSRIYPRKSILLRENLRSIKVLSHNAAVAGSSGLTRAAAGAVLGFLVAGPVGTVLGAGAGAGGAKRGTLDTYSIIVSFKSGEVILGDVTAFELEALREYLPRPDDMPSASTQQTVPAQPTVPVSPPNLPSKPTKASSSLPPAIKGRKTKRMPMGPSPLVAWLGDPGESVILSKFRWHLKTALDSLNTIKWRHYDQEISKSTEVVECVLIAISATASSANLNEYGEKKKEELQGYLSNSINPRQFDAAWSNPTLSSSVSIVKAERIISSTRMDYMEPIRKSQEDNDTPGTKKSISDIEEHLRKLKDLLDRGLIEKNEYDVARARALEL